ncbi:hypothetical protein [Noviherbaspirillum autotrophicum]|uniref:hypothetical protein n=1 Tax=Noviherbaspirillum autotrophicum TaxID=709839 RepID=UPI000588EB37|nr:hypothetical protein [Noviherbaspirillum autotrophicum]
MMRYLILLPAWWLSSVAVAAPPHSDFSGVWTALVCPSGVKNDPARCGHFVLELFQKQDKLCGSHLIATPDAAQMDDGAGGAGGTGGGPTLTGTVAADKATVTVAGNRGASPAGVQAELTLGRGTLQWHRLDKPARNDLLPVNVRLTKSRAKTFLNPVFAQQLSAACSMISIQPADHEGTPATTPPHQQLHPGQRTGLAENDRHF